MVVGLRSFPEVYWFLMLFRFTLNFHLLGLPLPIFFRKKFKKFWQRRFENGYWFRQVSRRFIGSDACSVYAEFHLKVCFFQIFSEKNLKNFGRGVLKTVIGFDEFPVGLLVLMSLGLR